MGVRIGKVTNVYPDTGKVKVMYEDEGNASLPLPMLTMNQEYSMPVVGDWVITVHMENGSSKGFVLGTYYGGSIQPKTDTGYRKDFGEGVYVTCRDGKYLLSAGEVVLKCHYGEITLKEMMQRIERIEDRLGLPHTL